MKAPWTDPGLWELFALLTLAALGFRLALARDDLMFTSIFAVACGVSIVGLMRHSLTRVRALPRAHRAEVVDHYNA